MLVCFPWVLFPLLWCPECPKSCSGSLILWSQYCFVAGLLKAIHKAVLWFFTIFWINQQVSWFEWDRWCCCGAVGEVNPAFCNIIHLNIEPCLTQKYSWVTFIMRETWHCILTNKFQLAQSSSECSAKGSMILWVQSQSSTDFPLHATVSAPGSLKVELRQYHTVKRSPYTPAALLLKELWSPAVPGVIIEPDILLVEVLPSMIHAHALWSCWYNLSKTVNALLALRASRNLSSEPIHWNKSSCQVFANSDGWVTPAIMMLWLWLLQ